MKVAFNRTEETRGMFRKKKIYQLTYRVELNPEERAIVDDPETGDLIFYEYHHLAMNKDYNCTIKSACRPEGGAIFQAESLAEIVEHENMLRGKFKSLADHLRALASQSSVGESVEEF